MRSMVRGMRNGTGEEREAIAPEEFARKDIEFHSKTAASYDASVTDEHRLYHAYSLIPFLDAQAAGHPHARVLDLGCGTGVVSLALASRGFRVSGIDHSREMLEIARRKYEQLESTGEVAFEVGDVTELRFPDGSFDGVTCQGLLHHLADLRPCLAELNRVLRPGGFFYISEPCSDRTVAKRLLVLLWSLFRRHDESVSEDPETVEAPIQSAQLRSALDELGLHYRIGYLTHLPRLHGHLPESLRLRLTKIISFPWRNTKGDLLFVRGTKPREVAAQRPTTYAHAS